MYGNLVVGFDGAASVSVDGATPDFIKKDYRAVMKAIDKKQGK